MLVGCHFIPIKINKIEVRYIRSTILYFNGEEFSFYVSLFSIY